MTRMKRNQTENQEDKNESNSRKNDQANGAVTADGIDHEHCNTSIKLEIVSVIALRTVPVKLKNGNNALVVNALLDDASRTTYINYDLVSKLGLQGPLETVSISTMKNVKTYPRVPVACDLLSCDRTLKPLKHYLQAYTTNKITGNMRPIEWRVNAKEWPRLRKVQFPKLGSQAMIDILIGADHPNFHRSLEEIRGNTRESIAQKTPLGWTCMGPPCP